VSGGFLTDDRTKLFSLVNAPNATAVATAVDAALLDDFAGILGALPPPPDNDGIAVIRSKTDSIVITSGRVEAAIDDSLLAKEATVETVSTRTARVDALIEDSDGDRFTPKALEAVIEQANKPVIK
jgi:hypothetical protein